MNHSDWTLLGLCALAGAGASLATAALAPDPSKGESRAAEPIDASELSHIETDLDELVLRTESLEHDLAAARLELGTGGARRSALGGVDAAVERWMQRHAPEAAARSGAEESEQASDVDLAVDRILSGGLFEEDNLAFWKELRDSGRLDAVLARMEALVEHSPYDAELRTALAGVLIQKSFERGAGPEREATLERADEAYADALELDDGNWGARFGRAVTLSTRPGYLGKTPEAIAEFERLVSQQENSPAEPRFAQTYYYLGNLYAQSGDAEKAHAAWTRGLALFPDDEALKLQLKTSNANAESDR